MSEKISIGDMIFKSECEYSEDLRAILDTNKIIEIINRYGIDYIDSKYLKIIDFAIFMTDEQLDILFKSKPSLDRLHLIPSNPSKPPPPMYIPFSTCELVFDNIENIMHRLMEYDPVLYLRYKKDIEDSLQDACNRDLKYLRPSKIVLKVIDDYEIKNKRFYDLMIERGDLNK